MHTHEQVVPPFEEKERMITNNNRIVGAIEMTQSRLVMEECVDIDNSDIQKFAGNATKACRTSQPMDSPYGYDPVFMNFSPIYNGKQRAETFYNTSEIRADSTFPYGFYPHKYNSDAVDQDTGELSAREENCCNRIS